MTDWNTIREAEVIALGTIRVSENFIKEILHLIDEAYFALESDVQVLFDAERPLINDPKKAQDALIKLSDLVSNVKDLGLSEFDEKLGELSHAINKLDNISFKGNIYIET